MTDEPIGEGGAANSPPFPRSARDDPPRPPDIPAAAGAGDEEAHPAQEGWSDEGFGAPEQATAAGPEPRPRADNGDEPRGSQGAAARASAEVLRRLERTIHHGLGHLADQLEDAAGRIDQLADARLHALGPKGERAAGAAESAAGWLHGSADYLRTSELRDLQRDLERQVREKPLQSLLVSAGAGWLLGKIVR